MDREEDLHQQVVDYLRLKYPDVLFRTDMGGIRLTPGLRAKAKRLQGGRAWPDLFIAQSKIVSQYNHEFPGMDHVTYHGLFIELKREGTKIYKKDGSLVANEHYREQAEVLERLQGLGYFADFACGFDQARTLIDSYLS